MAEHDQEQVFDIGTADQRRQFGPQDIGAARAADEVPVGDQGLDHHGERKRGDREEHAAQAEREIAGAEPHQGGHHAADHDHCRQRQPGHQLVEHDARISADGEEGGDAEIHVAGVATQNVPSGAEHDVLHDHVGGEECVVVADPARDAEDHSRRHDQRPDESDVAQAAGRLGFRALSGQGCHWASPPRSRAAHRTQPPAPKTGRGK